MPTTANNETLERIKNEVASETEPVLNQSAESQEKPLLNEPSEAQEEIWRTVNLWLTDEWEKHGPVTTPKFKKYLESNFKIVRR